MADVKKKKWRKILYKKQDYPDNYLDEEQFKKDLKINLNAKYYNISECIQGSIIVTQETGSIFLYINIFWLMEDNVLSPQYISSFLFLSMISLWSVATLTRASTIQLSSQLIDHVQQFSLFLFFLIGTSPILKTLTESISTDTIWTLAIFMFIFHLLCHDYGNDGVIISDSFSLNAAIFASVCLASRLSLVSQVFTALFSSVSLFGLLPRLRNSLQMTYVWFISLLTSLILIINISLLFYLSIYGLMTYFFVICLVSLICPLIFVSLQRHKETIHGPWDEAVIDLSTCEESKLNPIKNNY